MVDVVGLRFVSEGEQQVIGAIQNVDRAQRALESTSRALEGAIKRGAATFEQAVTAYIALERAGVTYADVLRGVEQDQRMAAEAAQYQTNKLLNVEQGYRSARDSAAVFSAALQEQAQAASQALQWTAALNERMGVTGQRATELGATFGRLIEVQRNLAAGATAWTTQLNQRMGVTGQRATELGATFERLAEVQRNLAAGAAAWTAQLNERLGITGTYKDAADSAEVFIGAQNKARASIERLRAAIDPAVAAQLRMRQAHETVRQALAAEVITRDQAAQTLRAYRAAAQTMTSVNIHTTRSMNDFGVGVQQVGYQVGDFLVQIQSGTNAFVAFGQQATQLVGILPMFGSVMGISGTALVALSAGLGIAIPLVTALAAAFMRTRDSAADASGSLDSLESRVESLTRTLTDYERARSALDMGVTPEQLTLNEQIDAQADAVARAREELQRLQDALSAPTAVGEGAGLLGYFLGPGMRADVDAASAALQEALRLLDVLNEKLAEEQQATFEQAYGPLQDEIALLEVKRQYGEESLQFRTRESQQTIANYEADIAAQVRSRELKQEQADLLVAANRELVTGNLLLENRAAIEDGLAATQGLGFSLFENIAAIFSGAVSDRQDMLDLALQELQAIEDRRGLAETELQYGRDSVQYRQMALDIETSILTQRLRKQGIDTEIVVALVEEYRAMRNVEIAANGVRDAVAGIPFHLRASVDAANALAAALANARAQSAGIGISAAGIEAEIAALESGATRAEARAEAAATTLRQTLEAEQAAAAQISDFVTAAQTSEIDRAVQERYDATLRQEQANERLAETYRAIADAASEDGGGGGMTEQDVATLESYVAEMEQRILLERELLALSGAARREAEIRQELEQRLASEGITYTEEAIAAAAARLAAQEDINKRIGEQQDAMQSLADDLGGVFADFFESGFSDFESFTDGILGIFQKMLADMIAEAASAQVMKFLMGSAGGATSTGALAGGVASAGKVAAGGGGAMNIVSSVAGTAGAMTGLGGAIAGLAGPAAIAIGLFSIFRARQQRRNAEEKKESDERYKLETRLLELQGKTGELREREIEALHPGNRALGRRIQRLEDEQRITAEREALELQMLQLQGDVAELRRRELAALDESNRALQKEIWALQDAAAIALERAGLEQQLLQLQGDTAALRQMELDALDESNRALQEQIWALEDQAAAAEEAARVADEQANLEQQLLQLQGDTAALRALELEALDESNRALQEQIWTLEDAAAIADERAGLEQQLLQLQGDTAALRALELEALDESNRALQEQIWALEDQAAVAEEAARVADERTSLERQLLELQGDTATLRAMDLEQLDASNQALQLQIWALEDQAAAAEEAARIADERAGLERQLLELQGDTNALRQLDLAALDASNRALQIQIWALEDMKRVLDDIDMNDFVSLVDYNRAVARANAEVMAGTANLNTAPVSVSTIPTPPVTTSTPTTTAGGSTGAIGGMTDVEVRDAVRYLTDITQQLLTKIDNNTRRSSNVLTTWDEDGIPPERAA